MLGVWMAQTRDSEGVIGNSLMEVQIPKMIVQHHIDQRWFILLMRAIRLTAMENRRGIEHGARRVGQLNAAKGITGVIRLFES